MTQIADPRPLASTPPDLARAPRGRWTTIAFVALLYALSMIDRFILSVLAQPVTASLGLTNVQLGLLLGAGFALLYALVGIPIAHFTDRGNRKRLVVFGVLFWSLTTIASAFATDFTTLLIFRAGVAIGEAVLTPAALSIIADLFPRDKRAFPTSVYMSVGNFMASGAFIAGAAALDAATALQGAVSLEPWRMAFVIVGLPGIVLALAMAAVVREPARVEEPGSSDRATTRDAIAYLKANARTYAPFFLGTAAISTATLGLIAWAPTLLQRIAGVAPASASYIFGTIGVPATLAGTFLLPWLATRIDRHGRGDGVIIVLMACVALAPPAVIAAVLVPSLTALTAAFALAMFLLPSVTVLTSFALQTLSPNRMRARMIALNFLAVNMFGYTVGPLVIATAADVWFEGPAAAGYGLALLMGVAAPIAFVCYALARASFGRMATAHGEAQAAARGSLA